MHSDLREKELVHAAQQGDRESFALLYEANVEKVYHYLLARMGQHADAEDVTAEVFIRAIKALPSYKEKGVPFVAWLIRIGHNLAVNHMKKQKRQNETPLTDTFASLDDPEKSALGKVASQEISNAMTDLTDLQRQVLALRFSADLSIEETAKVMKRTKGTVKSLQHSAVQAMRRNLIPLETARSEG